MNVTPNGKEINIVRDAKTAHLKIQFSTGGEIPEMLDGFYTSHTQAQKAINKYLESKKDKKEK